MRCSLTKQNRIDPERGHVTEYEWHGHKIEVCDSARTVVGVVSSFRGSQEAAEAIYERLFLDFEQVALAAAVEPGDYERNLESIICDALWDVCGLDATPDKRHSGSWEEPLFSWEGDAGRIRSSLLMAYGINWDDIADKMSFSEVCALLQSLFESRTSTPFQQAVMYRGEPPEHVKKDPKLMDAWRECASHYSMEEDGSKDAMAAADAAMADIFASAERAARGR